MCGKARNKQVKLQELQQRYRVESREWRVESWERVIIGDTASESKQSVGRFAERTSMVVDGNLLCASI